MVTESSPVAEVENPRHSVVGVPSVGAGKDVDLVKLKVFDAKLSLVDPFTVTSNLFAGNCTVTNPLESGSMVRV